MLNKRWKLVFATGAAAAILAATAPAQPAPAGNAAEARVGAAATAPAPQARRARLDEAIAALDELVRSPMPRGLTRAEQDNWQAQTAWLASVRDRYRALSRSYMAIAADVAPETEAAAPLVPGGAVVSAAASNVGGVGDSSRGSRSSVGPTPDAVTRLDAELGALQSTFETESRRFQTLSNASKARHDTAKAIIQNLKA